VDSLLAHVPAWAWQYLQKVTPVQWWYAQNVALLLVVLGAAWSAHYCFRRAFGTAIAYTNVVNP